MDGKYAYVQKKPGVLGLVSSFRSVDFLTLSKNNKFIIKGSPEKVRLLVESTSNAQNILNLNRKNVIYVMDYGNTVTRKIGSGRNGKLHLKDEWISFFDPLNKVIHLQNLITQKKFEIKLSKKSNPFFMPEVEMISPKVVIYSDINEYGYAALVSFDLQNLKSSIIHKSTQSATKIELCKSENYIGVGEFPYEGVSRGSKIQVMNINESGTFSSFTTVYNSSEQDLGNIICHLKGIYFVKTITSDQNINYKTTEAALLNIKTHSTETLSNLKHVAQLVEMDGRIIIPYRGEFYVVEGTSDIAHDVLKTAPSKEELEIDI